MSKVTKVLSRWREQPPSPASHSWCALADNLNKDAMDQMLFQRHWQNLAIKLATQELVVGIHLLAGYIMKHILYYRNL